MNFLLTGSSSLYFSWKFLRKLKMLAFGLGLIKPLWIEHTEIDGRYLMAFYHDKQLLNNGSPMDKQIIPPKPPTSLTQI
jgi:predicted outer membrane lipoprotein